MRAVLAPTLRVENTARQRRAQTHRHIKRSDGEILFHPVACRPAYNASAEQIDDDGEVEPTFVDLDVGEIACRL